MPVDVEEPELVVDEPEPEPEVEVEDVPLDGLEAVEEDLVDLRLAELTVPLVLDEPFPVEPVGTILLEFAPAGIEAAGT